MSSKHVPAVLHLSWPPLQPHLQPPTPTPAAVPSQLSAQQRDRSEDEAEVVQNRTDGLVNTLSGALGIDIGIENTDRAQGKARRGREESCRSKASEEEARARAAGRGATKEGAGGA